MVSIVPDAHGLTRSENARHLEFCENCANAFADDASTRLCEPDFFAQYSVAELAQQSDLWLNAQGRIAQRCFSLRVRITTVPSPGPRRFNSQPRIISIAPSS